jgi:hypothetical protein
MNDWVPTLAVLMFTAPLAAFALWVIHSRERRERKAAHATGSTAAPESHSRSAE